ncbi:hypothetical protein PhCBS80983_g06197 [Powellomyces hirtus]|uniref:SF3 helicase domain-containing protein n=1 Tax=Powellomyces hirtus TaxID=109895 RepID=A0A507DPW8_9FUNG|nr:hypothetical protein PhCBS80983_g06197 [Powellomyces hirtus]
MTAGLLQECETYIMEKTGINMKLSEKSLAVSDSFLHKMQLKFEPADDSVEEQHDEQEKSHCKKQKKKDWHDINFKALQDLPGWDKFDFRRVVNWTHVNSAEWFIEERHGSVMHHASGLTFILGKDNIWRMYDTVKNSDLNIQIGKSLIASYKKLLEAVEDDGEGQDDNLEVLKELFTKFRRDMETNGFSENVGKNVSRMAIQKDNCIDLFLSNPHLWAFTDKVYDLIKGEYRNIEPTDYILHTCGYPAPTQIDANICQKIEDFYSSLFQTSALCEYRKKIVARCLYGALVEEICILQKGRTRNGKGTETTLIRNSFGSYFVTIDKKNLTREQGDVDKPNSQMFNIFGARYISSSETSPKDRFVSSIIKGLSGNDPFPVRTLGGKPITFVPTGLINIQTNEDPVFDTMDAAIASRPKIQEYPFTFTANDAEAEVDDADDEDDEDDEEDNVLEKKTDPELKAMFRSENCRDAFIALFLRKFGEYFVKNGKLNFHIATPLEVQEFTRKNLMKSLSIAAWLKEHYQITGNDLHKEKKKDMYVKYIETSTLCESTGKHQFYKELSSILKEKKTATTRYYVGVRSLE